jgi:hypothetical protein
MHITPQVEMLNVGQDPPPPENTLQTLTITGAINLPIIPTST